MPALVGAASDGVYSLAAESALTHMALKIDRISQGHFLCTLVSQALVDCARDVSFDMYLY